MNLYEETLKEIKESKHTVDDVIAVVDDRTQEKTDIDKFLEQAKTIDYDNGWGIAEINPCLRVIFKDGSWLERGEYDGSEWWEYASLGNIDNYKQVDIVNIEYER